MNDGMHMTNDDWKERKKQERIDLILAQRDALMDVFGDGETIVNYLTGRGRLGSSLTSGNAALVLKRIPTARAVMSYDDWKRFGRSVGKGVEGIAVLVRNNGYLNPGRVFDVSQTFGNKPFPVTNISQNAFQLEQALVALQELCFVPVEKGKMERSVAYDAGQKVIHIDPNAAIEDVFRMLPVAIVCSTAEQHTEGVSENEYTRIFATAVSVELCGRFGISPAEDAAAILNGYRSWVEAGAERVELESVRELSKTMGNHIAKRLVLERALPVQESRVVR